MQCTSFLKKITMERTILSVFSIFILHQVCGDYVNVINLNSNWMLINQNKTIFRNKLNLPSGVYSVLSNEEVLESYNDINMRWIAYDNWTYINNFQVEKSYYKNVRYANLTFHGIDTVAEIYLNHELLGRVDNMFVRYSFEIANMLKDENILEVKIKSPIFVALDRAKKLEALNRTAPPNCPNRRYHGECHINTLRKMQASFAWDWGLAAPSMGLWKEVTLELYEVAILRDVDVAVSKNETHWNMHVNAYLDASGHEDFFAELIFYAVELLDGPITISDYTKKPISYLSPVISFDQAVPIKKVSTWWPNGFGEQKLYPLHITAHAWVKGVELEHQMKTTSQKSLRVGFRTIELVERELLGGDGTTFLFKVNGIEIFMKGTNYIPSHILPELGQNKDRIKHLLQSAKDVHMNMIRVWGGGIYESDYFYDLTDRLGILVWQDMMFACAMYPVTENFLTSVRLETIQNAKRLAHHPSIAIFVSNNENEVALVQNWYQTLHDIDRFETEYRELFLANILHELKLVEHGSRPRPLVSSPSNAKESEKDNFISDDPQSPYYGDVHFYDVFKDGWNADIYPRPRFASEYGFQSLPGAYAWQRILHKEDDLLALISHRQHHPLAMLPITGLVHRHLPLPLPEDKDYAEALIYFSQIAQAMATKVETEFYRSLRDTEHNTMGALYWQLNDVWVAPSWSSIDIFGNWKLLHYWARDFLAPLSIVALFDNKNNAINITLICDKLNVDTENLTVSANTHLWSELFVKNSTQWPVTLRPNGVHYDKIIPLNELLRNGFTAYNSFFEFELLRGHECISRTYYFPSSISAAKGICDPDMQIDISSRYCAPSSSNLTRVTNSLTITIKRPAIFVYLELLLVHKNIKFSKNGFIQVKPVEVIYLEYEASSCIRLRKKDIKVLTVNQFMT